jgi:hypothetical protein
MVSVAMRHENQVGWSDLIYAGCAGRIVGNEWIDDDRLAA